MTQKMNKFNSLKKTTKVDFATYLGVIAAFVIVTVPAEQRLAQALASSVCSCPSAATCPWPCR